MNTKTLLKIVGSIVLVIAIIGGYIYPKVVKLAGTSPSGATFGDQKIAMVAVNLANPGANGTSTSILNTDSNDRYVESSRVGCENVGSSKTAYSGTALAALQFSVGTSSTAAPTSIVPFAFVASAVNLSTSTGSVFFASSTLATATSSLAAIWPTNTYMTFTFNATNTATCTVGVSYFGS